MHESLVGSGQTLLLLVDIPLDNKEPEVAISKYVLMITPEHIPIVKEEVTVDSPQTDAATKANP